MGGSVCGTDLGKLIAAQAARSGAGHEQQQSSHGSGLQAGKVVDDAAAPALIPALGGERVQRLAQAHAGAGHKIRGRLQHGVGIGQHLQRQRLLPFFPAQVAAGQMLLQLMDLFVGKFPIRRSHDSFLCKFAIHRYVLPASKSSPTVQLSVTVPPPTARAAFWSP